MRVSPITLSVIACLACCASCTGPRKAQLPQHAAYLIEVKYSDMKMLNSILDTFSAMQSRKIHVKENAIVSSIVIQGRDSTAYRRSFEAIPGAMISVMRQVPHPGNNF